jgi:hypothetical protein
MIARRGHTGEQKSRLGPPGIDDIEAYADHVVKFSLAGIRAAIRGEAENEQRDARKQYRS